MHKLPPRTILAPALFFATAAAASVLLFASPSAQATTYSYTSTGTTNWSTATWSPSTPVSSLDNVLSFTVSTNAKTTTNNLGTFQLNSLTLTNNSTSSNPQNLIISGSSNTLNFVKDSNNVLPTLVFARGAQASGTITLAAPLTVTDALTITNSSPASAQSTSITGAITNTGGMVFDGTGAATVTLGTGIVSGVGGITKNGSYTLVLSGANTYTGGTTISAGTVKLGNAKALGGNASAASVTSGAVLDLNGTAMTNTNALALNGTGISSGGALINSSATAGTYAGLVTLGSASSIIAGTGNITLSNAGTITGSGFGLTVGGAKNTTIASIIGTGAGTLTKQDAGTLTLNAANTYTGDTTISAGTLALGSSGSLASAVIRNNGIFDVSAVSGGYTIASGQTLQGAGSVTGAITIASGATLAPGNSPGVMTFNGALALAGTTVMEANGTGRGADYDGVNTGTGLLTYGGDMSVVFGSTFLTGTETFDLFNIGAGGSSGSFSSVSISGSYIVSLTNTAGVWTGSAGGYDFTFTQGTGDLVVLASAVPEPSTYTALLGALVLGTAVSRRKRRQRV